MTIFKPHILATSAFLLLMAFSLFADTSGGYGAPFLELPSTASSAALAAACVTYDAHPAALMWNPANLNALRKHSVQASVERMPLSTMRYALAASYRMERFRFAAAFLQHSIGKIHGMDGAAKSTGDFSYGYSAFSFGGSYGFDIRKDDEAGSRAYSDLAIGMDAKILWQMMGSEMEGIGTTLDMGLSGKYSRLTYGILLRNLYGTMLFENSVSDTLPFAVVIGTGFFYNELNHAEISLESKVSGRLRWRLGGQVAPIEWAAFRAGVDFFTGTLATADEMRAAAGGAIYYDIGIPIELSYALQYIPAVRGWAFSSSLSWNTF